MRRRRPRLEEVEVYSPELERTPGRNMKYNEEIPDKVHLLAKLGHTVSTMAIILSVAENTLEKWIKEKPEVREKLDHGRWIYDHAIELSLQRKALGYDRKVVKNYSGVDPLGRKWTRRVEYTEHVPPDTAAIQYWLKNRHPERWNEAVTGGVNLTQVNNHTLKVQMDKVLTPEERELVRSIAIKNLANMNNVSDGNDTTE